MLFNLDKLTDHKATTDGEWGWALLSFKSSPCDFFFFKAVAPLTFIDLFLINLIFGCTVSSLQHVGFL